ncbi:hypothetical protein LTR70_002528 [Exophiala xenobiotica]|uniref:RING-type domain-containing protein n=1 Tax=Lithohypha guttulata TaxID=1690604 RepID=A0ABR0KKZ9_9EURO|nr:hypothetical protein LTR24_001745 [Lithohypha guttulata]KAK5325362.1 hypothetical protein LTR70_002528 [Exophiala xenobiotica]
MASTHQSPVMVEQPSSPPTHSYASPDYALSILSPSASNGRTHQPLVTATMPEPHEEPTTTIEQTTAGLPAQSPSQNQASEEQAATSGNTNDGDDSSNSESNSESSTSTETPGTISTPRSSAHDSGHPVPDSGSTQLDRPNAEEPATDHNENAHSDSRDVESPNEQDADDTPSMPPPPNDIDTPVPDNIPSWVQYEEDTSTPNEAELKEIEAHRHELSAADTAAIEKDVFTDVDDPDLRPCKKIRLSWVVKGVRGTRERPNRARIMTSPAVCIDGMYWNLKFFPRGNKSRSSLSAYVRCSPLEPTPNKDDLVGSFKCCAGAPDADLAETEPILNLELKLPDVQEEEPPPPEPQALKEDNGSNEDSSEARRRKDHDDDDESISGDEDDLPEDPARATPINDYRVSAQLGLVIYNPAEPRTCHTSSASHQFCPHQDDWGWDTAASHWDDIHRRKRGQRQALLRDDTLAIDAYVRIYDDPTKALFWHSSPGETQWDSKGLAGVFPMGTRLLYHSPATAGITAWSLLAPFRAAIQSIDAGRWRKDSSVRPTPLIAHLQLVMFQMRNMKKEELYIHIDGVIHEITRSGESFDNVNTFWDAFRRSIEIETNGDNISLEALNDVFGTRELCRSLPRLPVQDVQDFQEAATKGLTKANFKAALPNFLPLTLDRQSFDTEKRQWQLHHDRVRISEEVDLSAFCTNGDGKYSLYGLVVHDGDRTSGKFFSVLRPTGPGGKWLMFSDGNGNKVFSYTKKRIQEYEGLVGADLRKLTSNRQTIHMALYIRTSRLSEYLRKEMEPYKLPFWLKPHLDETYHHNPDLFEPPEDDKNKDSPIAIEIFRDKLVSGQEGKLDLYKLKTSAKARQREYRQQLTADRDATVRSVRDRIAETLEIDQKAFKLWAMNYHRLGGVSKGYMYVLPIDSIISSSLNTSQYLSLWLTMVPGEIELEEDVLSKRFIEIDGAHVKAPPKPEPVVEEPPQALTEGNEALMTSEPPSLSDSIEATESNNNEAAPDDEQLSVQEAVAHGTQTTTVTRPTYPASAETGQSSTAQAEESAVPDAEQASVSEAVEQSVQNAASNHPTTTAEVVEVEPSDTTSQAHSSPGPEAVSAANNNASPEPTTAEASNAVAESEGSRSTSNVDALVPPPPSSEPQPTTPQPVTPSEPGTTLDVPIARASNDASDGTVPPSVIHGHLFEASSHADHPLSHGEPPLPVGIPIAMGDSQIFLVQPSQSDDISAEDAALISSMIAADLEAAERADGDVVDVEVDEHGEGQEDEVESEAADEVVDSRPTTPRPRVADIYGFLHIFDAEAQKLTAHGTFMVPRDTVISTMVRKEMGFDEEKTFHLWKRDGTYRTVSVSLESTFQDVSLTDCCEVMVGDQLEESKMEALKAEAKYVDPGQLMRYLAMVQRGHPIACTTTAGAVEINEFGSDYYKGPLVRGQRHGPCCQLITQCGDMYDGPLVAGQKSGGLGRMTYQNGDTYSGEWLDDMKHGQGEFMEKRTGNRYVGGYENDKRWGKGVTYWEQADQQASLCQVCYFEEVDALFYRCGHVVACYGCARQCASEGGGCPVCRKPIESVVKMYRS